jgi:serine-type D-Ala-D-Ala carboxypeptidase/endopeptidase
MTCRFVFLIALALTAQLPAAESFFAVSDVNSVRAFLRDNFADANAGMVIGLLDAHGSQVFSEGKRDDVTLQRVEGDTIFEIGSITKTFTALLLLDLVERGQMKLDAPVAEYLPQSVRVPSHGGKAITLLNLAAQDSGLPFNADNLATGETNGGYDAYTAQNMYEFLARFALQDDPGTRFQYSNLGMSLLGHAMELQTGARFESLVVERIGRPLHMDSTAITLTPELAARRATGHDKDGRRAPYYHLQVMAPTGALYSTANDLLKYLSAHLGLVASTLRPSMEQMQIVRHTDSAEFGRTAMPWCDQGVYNPPGTNLLGHAGGTPGFSTFIGFDTKQKRGVVVLSNQTTLHAAPIGWAILQRMPLSRQSGTQFVREIVGLGAVLSLDEKTGALQITKIVPKSPAAVAGLSPGLIIQRINGTSVAGKSLPESLALMSGPVGTKTTLDLLDPQRKETKSVALTRRKFLTLY